MPPLAAGAAPRRLAGFDSLGRMAILNRRNAVIGYVVVKLGKRAVKQKASNVAPTARTGGAIAGALAAVGGVLLVRRHHRHDDDGE
jgi:hypothetical protein